MALVFRGKDGSGTMTFPLRRKGEAGDGRDQLAKGMIAEFFLKSHQLSVHDGMFLSSLEDLALQDARLCLYSDGYFATEWRLCTFWDRLKEKWNRFALRINFKTLREVGKNNAGEPVVKQYRILPTFRVLGAHLRQFIAGLRNPGLPVGAVA